MRFEMLLQLIDATEKLRIWFILSWGEVILRWRLLRILTSLRGRSSVQFVKLAFSVVAEVL